MSQSTNTDPLCEMIESQTESVKNCDHILVMRAEDVFRIEKAIPESAAPDAPSSSHWWYRLLAALRTRRQGSSRCLIFCGVIACDELRSGTELLIKTSDQEYKGTVVCLEGSFGKECKVAKGGDHVANGGDLAAISFKAGQRHRDFLLTLTKCELYRVPSAYLTNVTPLCNNANDVALDR